MSKCGKEYVDDVNFNLSKMYQQIHFHLLIDFES